MKKKMYKLGALALLAVSMSVTAQEKPTGRVGINTPDPKATLDISVSEANKDATTNEGIMAPQLSKERVAKIAAPVEGTLVYVVDDADKGGLISDYKGRDAKVEKIDTKGYYYFDGTEWVKSAGKGSGASGEIWRENNFENNGVKRHEVQLPFLDSEGVKRNGMTAQFASPNGLNELDFSVSAYGILAKRYHDNINPTAIVLEKSRGTIDNPQEIKSEDVIGQLYFRVGDPTGNFEGHRDASFFRTAVLEYESLNSFSSELSWGVRRKGDDKPYFAMFLSPEAGLGIGGKVKSERLSVRGTPEHENVVKFRSATGLDSFWVTNDSKTFTRSLISLGEGMYGSTISIRNDSKVSNEQANKWTWFNTFNNNVASQTEGYREGLVLWAYSRNHESETGISGPKLMIADNGNVGIGTFVYKNAPELDEKLVVQGNVKAESFLGANGAGIFPDYVFEDYYQGNSSIKADYKFKSLSQVEDFVKQNGHLPGYASAKQIQKQGYVDLMATQLTNVEKIEELYLHSIEQDKALKAKDAKIQELEARLAKLEALLSK
ncbi:hypothetical protein [Ornithobacterium rhinotracheale]|uniref:hypothetical protein n=1 Tax=Ornithobacterium rhinotracheale TaxID=28251 RepID=UPI001FF3EEB9|nr:hypothetical protein [Ornithobacterium rhinotracheale]MCK0205814.1 hypothetical protein [Ornithobacterium rhinotracheale]